MIITMNNKLEITSDDILSKYDIIKMFSKTWIYSRVFTSQIVTTGFIQLFKVLQHCTVGKKIYTASKYFLQIYASRIY